jgi:hypothetical protein
VRLPGRLVAFLQLLKTLTLLLLLPVNFNNGEKSF